MSEPKRTDDNDVAKSNFRTLIIAHCPKNQVSRIQYILQLQVAQHRLHGVIIACHE